MFEQGVPMPLPLRPIPPAPRGIDRDHPLW
jgi:hypothetical protein